MEKILKEPLLVFLLLGGAMFLLFQQVSNDNQSDNSELVVTERQIKALSLGYEKVWQRPPNEKEVEGLIQNYIREEVLYREALAMGLDKGDGVVRRRLHQKMEFLSEDIASLDEPTEQELQDYLLANQDAYRQPARFSFRQVYLSVSKRGQTAQADAVALLSKLEKQDRNAATLGDPLMVNYQFNLATGQEIERVLGREFLQSLNETPTGNWQGPLSSGFGLHLVRIDKRIESEAPGLNEVRKQVVRDWGSEKRKQTNETFYEGLRKRYTVKIENNSRNNIPSGNTTKLSMIQKVK
jgi:peptidyl-prolyl cis-trans isomerase C